jgi:hypothetical protein
VTEPRDLRELLGHDAPADEVERAREADELLRRVPAPPPHVPDSLTLAVRNDVERAPVVTPLRRASRILALAAALAVAVAAGFFGLGNVLDRDSFEPARTIALEPTSFGRGASAEIALGERDADGNWRMRVDVRGLPELPRGGYYLLWLEKDGEYGGTCGSFNVGDDETAVVDLNASYRLADYDRFVVTAEVPGAAGDDPPHLLEGRIPTA